MEPPSQDPLLLSEEEEEQVNWETFQWAFVCMSFFRDHPLGQILTGGLVGIGLIAVALGLTAVLTLSGVGYSVYMQGDQAYCTAYFQGLGVENPEIVKYAAHMTTLLSLHAEYLSEALTLFSLYNNITV